MVSEGRLEFVNAGWSMNDEACPYYTDIIDNMRAGHDWLFKEFGVKPTVGWHLDPFGHSSANQALFAEMGFDAFFFSRLDYQDKAKRMETKELEWIWEPFADNRGDASEIFTHTMFDHYYPPPGFCWATNTCPYYDEPVVDNPNLKTYNVEERTQTMLDWVMHMHEHYRSNHLLIPMGGDFFFKNAHKIFKNVDKLIETFNNRFTNYQLVYSTPGKFMEAIKEADVTWPVKRTDMFPYADGEHAYWTGYFTSRATAKGFVRDLARGSHSSHKMSAISIINKENTKEAPIMMMHDKTMEAIGVMQHHDAVTGTAKQAVQDDYDQIVNEALKDNALMGMSHLFQPRFGTENVYFCEKTNGTSFDCPTKDMLSQGDQMHFIVTSEEADQIGRIKIPSPNFEVSKGAKVVDQAISCNTASDCEMFFQIPVGFHYGIVDLTSLVLTRVDHSDHLIHESGNRIKNDYQTLMHLSIPTQGARMWYVSCETPRADPLFGDKTECEERNITLSLKAYDSYAEQGDGHQNSGAYIFRPATDKPLATDYWTDVTSKFYTSNSFMQEIVVSGSKARVNIRLFKGHKHGVEIETHFFGIDRSGGGKEVTLNIGSDNCDNQGIFYTDSNGLEMQKRVFNG